MIYFINYYTKLLFLLNDKELIRENLNAYQKESG